MKRVLSVIVVDDDRVSCKATTMMLQKQGYEAAGIEDPFLVLERLRQEHRDVVLTDLRMPSMNGIEFLKRIKEEHPDIDVILMTAYATVETAVEAMHAGAADYLVKPFRLEELDHRLKRLHELREVRSELDRLHAILDEGHGAVGLVGRSQPMRTVFERIEIFADHDAPVLITGETGTGKELVTRALHRQSRRRDRPLVPIACGAIPPDLAESELFGHEKGAFTGAHQRRQGSFERADGGTVLLDDVDDLPLGLQVKLLRVLQEGKLIRVGGTEEISIDVRVVATTKVDLPTAARDGRFRDDLFYRLSGLEIHLPPLRDRGEDVLLLTQHVLRVLAARDGGDPKKLSLAAADLLRRHDWPGNVRELRRALESASILCRGDEIAPEHLPYHLQRTAREDLERRPEPFTLNLEGQRSFDFNELVQRFEDALILWAMARAGGQQTAAAELLGLPRTTLQSKIARLPATGPQHR